MCAGDTHRPRARDLPDTQAAGKLCGEGAGGRGEGWRGTIRGEGDEGADFFVRIFEFW